MAMPQLTAGKRGEVLALMMRQLTIAKRGEVLAMGSHN
jgi:hypothetical protein